jgi:hypothetical protein
VSENGEIGILLDRSRYSYRAGSQEAAGVTATSSDETPAKAISCTVLLLRVDNPQNS